jgi:hypothetical protein
MGLGWSPPMKSRRVGIPSSPPPSPEPLPEGLFAMFPSLASQVYLVIDVPRLFIQSLKEWSRRNPGPVCMSYPIAALQAAPWESDSDPAVHTVYLTRLGPPRMPTSHRRPRRPRKFQDRTPFTSKKVQLSMKDLPHTLHLRVSLQK